MRRLKQDGVKDFEARAKRAKDRRSAARIIEKRTRRRGKREIREALAGL